MAGVYSGDGSNKPFPERVCEGCAEEYLECITSIQYQECRHTVGGDVARRRPGGCWDERWGLEEAVGERWN